MSNINFEDCLYFSSARFNRIVTQMSDQEFKRLGLSSTSAFILMALNADDVVSPSEIADQLYLDRSTITRFLDKLERDGYLTRTADGRRVHVQLTSAGKLLQPQLKIIWSALNEAYQQLLGKPSEERIRTLLNTTYNHITKK
ncbi:MarR family winged helix-turn-helix transcriptional regulator [Levilactobacillus bambusae]|uniref:Transcriptional regulator n=1 Tax=Levilactobacillus bambusae TaxID=2024736 RepID=A0A2V1MZB0_9LACO|nr:MarR family transcriptional regulator [Levilactobacillus bambusae]PWG00361.1 transcriptional regulator [Levilactobacillus bambusae]